MKNKRILLLGGNYFPEPTGIGKYNTEMMDWLSVNGCECGIVTTFPYYPFWRIQQPYVNKSTWYKKEKRVLSKEKNIVIYRCPHYVPSVPTGIKRVLSDLSFFLSAFFQVVLLLFRKKYDYVMVVAPPFQIGLLGWLYKKVKGATLVYHIQDLQIDAAVDLGMIKSKYIVRLMFGLERFILKKSDFVSSISDGMIKKIKAKYNRQVILFPNWADISAFHPISDKNILKMQFDFLSTDKIVLYSGAIGEKQGLQTLLHIAKDLEHLKYLKFVICGSGPYKERLVSLAHELGLNNIFFMPLQPKEKFNQFLNMADVHLIMQKANENELFLPSKLTTICAVGGLVIVTASKNTSLHNLVSEYNLGILTDPDDQTSLTEAIKDAIYQDKNYLKNNARQYAVSFLSLDKIAWNYFSAINPNTSVPEKIRKNNFEVIPSENEIAHQSVQHSFKNIQEAAQNVNPA